MSYYGATQASSLANPPRQIVAPLAANPVPSSLNGQTMYLTTQGSTGNAGYYSDNTPSGAGVGGSVWYYVSTNLTTDLTAAGNQPFFSDGFQLGMKPGDLVMGAQFTSAGSSVVGFNAFVTYVTTLGAALSTGATITSTFN